MKTQDDLQKTAQQIQARQLEFFGFAMEAKKREAAIALDEYAELKRRRAEAARLLRLLGAEVPELEEAAG